MRRKFTLPLIYCLCFLLVSGAPAFCQNAVLVNFGDTSCGGPAPPSLSLLRNPLASNSSLLTNCDLQTQLPDFYFVFVAYNPADGKIYIADTRTGATKIWVLDMSLPQDIACPGTIPAAPDHTYSYVSNNFEFDNNGNLWSFSQFVDSTGQAHIDRFDVNTGTILSTSVLQFPAGNYPSGIYSGDLSILPNRRMFAVLGIPSKLYEIKNYDGVNASAFFLQNIPKNCYGLSYLNGELELTGFDGAGCYRYEYSIGNNTLGPELAFQNGQTPIDNTSISPTIGTAKQLLSAQLIDPHTASLSYRIYVKNIGNVKLNGVGVVDDLRQAFHGANVTGVTTQVHSGSGIILNPAYDGVNDVNILGPGVQLANNVSNAGNYDFSVDVNCTVTNLDPNVVYYNSAVATASIGTAANNTKIDVADSSNNGDETAIDVNGDANASEAGENNATPFFYGALPVHFLNFTAKLRDENTSDLNWQIATPESDADYFEPQFSSDGQHFTSLGLVQISDPNRAAYFFPHSNLPPGNLFYRIKQVDKNGSFIFSRIVKLPRSNSGERFSLLPNPASDYFIIMGPATNSVMSARLLDTEGRLLRQTSTIGGSVTVDCHSLPTGTYFVQVISGGTAETKKLIIQRP